MAVERLGPYRLEKVIGRGGMGTVYAASNTETGERVAVKLLAHNIAQEEHFRQRFEAEIESLIKLDHPNIVRILAYDVDGENMYYAMELVEGRSLFDEQQKGRQFDWREVARIGKETCAALQHAHDRGILHRDLKPGNLLLETTGHIKLTDFGIAKLFGGRQLTVDGGVIGTVDYMSPEQAKGGTTSPRSDLYSLGSVMFALLARRPPFQAKTVPATLQSLSMDPAPPIRDFAPETPEEFEQIIARLLAKNPEARIGSARSVAKRLEAMLENVQDMSANRADQEFELHDQEKNDKPTKANIDAVCDKPTAEHPPAISSHAGAAEAQSTRRAPSTRATPQFAEQQISERASEEGHTEVTDEVRRLKDDLGRTTEERRAIWPLAVGLIVLVSFVVLGIAYASRPPTADQLFDRIQSAAGDEDTDKLVTVEKECRDFQDRFPQDSRAERVGEILDQIESLRYLRQLQRRRQTQGFAELSPAEQIYVAALEVSETHPERAMPQFAALVDLFQDDPDEVDCVRVARKQMARLENVLEQIQKKHAQVLAKQLNLARRLLESDSPSAEKLLRGMIRLYGDKPWAENEVRQARELLNAGDSCRPSEFVG